MKADLIQKDLQQFADESRNNTLTKEYIFKRIGELDKIYGGNKKYSTVVDGLICNIGREQKHIDVLKYVLSRLMKKEKELKTDKFYYDIATIKYALADFSYNRKISGLIYSNEYAEVRKCYNKVTIKDLNHFLRARTNTANLLEKYGRNYEAIFVYDSALKYDPHFGMALGNKANALIYYFRLSPYKSFRLLHYAQELFQKAIQDKRIVDIGGKVALEVFQYELDKINNYLKKNNYYKIKKKSCFINEYYKFSLENNLFLNYDFGFYYDELSLKDSLFPNLIENLHDEKHPKSPSISKKIYYCFQTFNQILEDYVSSRYLFYKAVNSNFKKIDYKVDFIYLLDYNLNSTKYGLLKKVYANIYNCLDKIAQMVLYYFDINKLNQNNDIYFDSLINDHFKKIIISENSYQLLALLNMACDFNQGYPYYKYRALRNRITHSFININSGILSQDPDCENELLEEDLIENCKDLFHIAKAAIMYFVLYFIHTKIHNGNNGKKLIIGMNAVMQREVY